MSHNIPKNKNLSHFCIHFMVLDIFNHLRGLFFKKIKHYVFPVLVMLLCHEFWENENEFLKIESSSSQNKSYLQNLFHFSNRCYGKIDINSSLMLIARCTSRSTFGRMKFKMAWRCIFAGLKVLRSIRNPGISTPFVRSYWRCIKLIQNGFTTNTLCFCCASVEEAKFRVFWVKVNFWWCNLKSKVFLWCNWM